MKSMIYLRMPVVRVKSLTRMLLSSRRARMTAMGGCSPNRQIELIAIRMWLDSRE